VYGDIVHESGFTETLATAVDLPTTASASKLTDADDASHFAATPPNAEKAVLEDGSVMSLQHSGRFVAERPADLHFSVINSEGKPLSLEPYIGMAGHAVVTRDDGAVFIHLHPSGTISMASQMAFEMRQPGDTISGRLGQRIQANDAMRPASPPPTAGVVAFPYAFPKSGKYHMWVQVKHSGRILTGAFAFDVAPAR
ncbi:MAG: hypothetical protein ABR585_12310, partial [Gemmatimonadaceae bacterium]